jgi:hypothetical protein
MRAVPGVRFVTAGDLPALYPDLARTAGITESELDELARRIANAKDLNFQLIGGKAFSVADQFELFTLAVDRLIEGQPLDFPLVAPGLLGPDSEPPPTREEARLAWPAFRDTTRDVLGFIQAERRVPARVFIGPDPVPPADFVAALVAAYQFYRTNGRLPMADGVSVAKGIALLPARYVADDTPKLFGDWVIHREGFRAPKVMAVARLQAWTLKPAVNAQ